MKRRCQVSVEYMLIVGFAALMAIPMVVVYYKYSSSSSETVSASQALVIARKIVDASESVYYLGKPSQTTLKINFPPDIYLINVSGREVVFRIKTRTGVTDIVQVSSVNITGNLPSTQGMHVVTVAADDGYVRVSSN